MSDYLLGDEPYRQYLRALYPDHAAPDTQMHWYSKWKTYEMCIGLFGQRQRARHALTGNDEWREGGHPTAVVTFHASPVRSLTAQVCLRCLWISTDLDETHANL
jgi:hypothetical protein